MTEDRRPDLPPLKLRSKRRLFPDMIEIRRPRRPPKLSPQPVEPARLQEVAPPPAGPVEPAPAHRPDPATDVAATSEPRERAPMYWRLLRLRHIQPNGWLRALFVEGSVGLAVVLVLAEKASIWTIIALPIVVAVLVKANDVVAGALRRPS